MHEWRNGNEFIFRTVTSIVIDQEVNFLLARSGVGQFSLKDDYLNLKIEKDNILGKNIIEEIAKTRMKEKEINELELSNKFKDFMNSLSLPNALERILSIKTLNILKKRDSIFKRPGSNENQFWLRAQLKNYTLLILVKLKIFAIVKVFNNLYYVRMFSLYVK